MKTIKLLALVLMGLAIVNNSLAQQIIIARVIDYETKDPLPGAAVIVPNTTEGSTTDLNGNINFYSKTKTDSIFVSYLGYQSKTIQYQPNIIVGLKSGATQINQIIISASRQRQERKDAPIAISTISPEIIDETKATSLDQVINKVNGVYMVDLGNEQHSMSIRQPLSTGSLFLYLEDGIPIRTTGIFNHNALIEINQGAIGSMEIIKGPASSLYGSGAIGGAVNFISQSPTYQPAANIQLQANNLGYKSLSFSASKSHKKIGIIASGYFANRQNGPRQHSDYNKEALTLRSDWNIGSKSKWTNSLTYVNYLSDMTGGLDSANFYSLDFSSLQTFTFRSAEALRYRSTFDYYRNSNSKLSISAFYRNNSVGQSPHYRIKDDFKPWSGQGNQLLAHGEVNENSFKSYGVVAQYKQHFNFLEANWITGLSMDYSPNEYSANYIRVNKDLNGVYSGFTKSDSLLADYNVNLLNTAAFTHFDFSPTNKLKIIAALRYDRIGYDYNNKLDSLAFSGAPDEKNYFDHLTPKIGFTYNFDDDIGIYSNYSVGFSPPEVTELYRGVKVPTLTPSTYKNYEIGGWMSFHKKKVHLEVSLYRMSGVNEIVDVKQADGSYEKENSGKTLHQGIEYALNYSPVKEIIFRFSAANSLHKYVDFISEGKTFNGNFMSAAPQFIANTELTYKPQFIEGLRISIELQHLGPYFLDEANTEKYKGYSIVNLRCGYEFKSFEIWLNTLNISDELYATSAGKSAWGKEYRIGDPRTFNLGVAYNFKGKTKNE